MDKYSISLIVIGSILIAIVARFIFNAAFRKDVIASEGEAKIFGLINVKGVIIVLLMAIFGGMFVYILELGTKNNNTKNIIGQFDKASKIPPRILKKQAEWEILHPDSSFSKLNNSTENGFFENKNGLAFIQNEKNTDSIGNETQMMNRIWVGSIYQLKNCKLCFRIDSIINEQKSGTNYIFYVSFGEGIIAQRDEINWRTKNLSFNKSPNGKIDFENNMIALNDENWKKDYLLYCDFGQPNAQLQSVEMVNIVALGTEMQINH